MTPSKSPLKTFTGDLVDSNLRFTSNDDETNNNTLLFWMMIVFGAMMMLLCCLMVRMWASHRSLEYQLQYGGNVGGNLREDIQPRFSKIENKSQNRRPFRLYPSIRVERSQRRFEEEEAARRESGESGNEGIVPGAVTTRMPGVYEEEMTATQDDDALAKEQHTRAKSVIAKMDKRSVKSTEHNLRKPVARSPSTSVESFRKKISPYEMKVVNRESEGRVSNKVSMTPSRDPKSDHDSVGFSYITSDSQSSQPGLRAVHQRSPARRDTDFANMVLLE